MKARTRNKTKEIALIGLFTAVTALLSQISIYIPISPVPISFGIMAVFFAGLLLKPHGAFLSLIVYLALGATGLPIFSGFKGGLGVILGPTGGFLFSYPLVALFVSTGMAAFTHIHKSKSGLTKKIIFPAFVFFVQTIALFFICYLVGTLYLAGIAGITFRAALGVAVLPFIAFDMLKIVVCTALAIPIRKRLATHLSL